MLLHQRGQDLLFRIVVEPQGNVNKQTGKNAAEERTLSVRSRAALSGAPVSPSQALPRRPLRSASFALSGAPAPPSQALPRQLPQRGSQGLKPLAKVLGETRKLPGAPKAPSPRELAKPSGFDWGSSARLRQAELPPQRRAFAESGAANAVARYDPFP